MILHRPIILPAALSLLLLALRPSSTFAALKVGDTICTEGYIMDFFCIDRGTLLDNPTVRTLEEPFLHTIHCLVDVNSCVSSPFEVLLDPPENSQATGDVYNRGWRLDEPSKEQAIELARSVGTCTTCPLTNDSENSHVKGFRAAMKATILDLNENDPTLPPIIQVDTGNMQDTTAYVGSGGQSACEAFFGMPDILDVDAAGSDGETVDEAPCASALEAGDEICTEGYVMDLFCIDRGTLFDNPEIVTLEDPGAHSIHCLVDVESCIASPFEILLDPSTLPDSDGLYSRGWRFDESSKQQAVELAQSVGTCTTCPVTNTEDNSHVRGFRVATRAVILDLNENDASVPPTIQVIGTIADTTAYNSTGLETQSACQSFFGMQDIVDRSCASAGANGGGGSLLDGIAASANLGSNTLRTKHFAHATLMILGWGFLLPSGAITAKFFKHRPDGIWFKLHRGIQMFGLLLALIGWIIALVNFNVFRDYGFNNYRHGICGMTVMILGLLQPLNAFLRPHPPSEGEAKSTTRRVWEFVHKCSGWAAVFLAIPTIILGTLSLPILEDQTKFQIGYVVGCGGGMLGLVAYMFYDKKVFVKENVNNGNGNQQGAKNPDKREQAQDQEVEA
ncbi:unnamed protein product [Pseudo-nitzschia multistriata]|uniref:Cytochrome b561 domain-containing protein n=1 Tax=Pseudo-nitzschia multistriata TaxID=183589 RepID=A0A448YW80_9STRA|nr:unnamed protein product [Pseudo-nitzschia multistriata]